LRELLGVGTVCTPDGVARTAQSLLEAFGIDPATRPTEVKPELVVVLDVSSAERIALTDPTASILIDHHEPDNLASRATAPLIDTGAGATAELIAIFLGSRGEHLQELCLPTTQNT
jgi:nanoRNase/pAp phosphatase (c-di-AMP/oligoRNAs hydrolase)